MIARHDGRLLRHWGHSAWIGHQSTVNGRDTQSGGTTQIKRPAIFLCRISTNSYSPCTPTSISLPHAAIPGVTLSHKLGVPSELNQSTKQELSYRKQIARELRTQHVEGIYRPNYRVTLKSRLRVTQGKRNHWRDHTRLSSSRVI